MFKNLEKKIIIYTIENTIRLQVSFIIVMSAVLYAIVYNDKDLL